MIYFQQQVVYNIVYLLIRKHFALRKTMIVTIHYLKELCPNIDDI